MDRLANKVALITGGGSGIGRATALIFAKEGAKVVVTDVDVAGGNETEKQIRDAGGQCIFIEADASSASDAEKMVNTAVSEFGRLDILFNNAGISSFVKMADMEIDEWDRVMAINLKGVFLGSKFAIPVMVEQGGGVIINTASTAAISPNPYTSVYAAAKAGVVQLTKSMALEYGGENIRANCICPGFIKTSMTAPIIPDNAESEKLYSKHWPLGKPGKPEDIAYAALYLASDEASFVTGTSLLVDGGWMNSTPLPEPDEG